MQFLCNKHRHWLEHHPDHARACWEKWMQQGYSAMDNHDWKTAISYFGCSYELSEIRLKQIGSGHEIHPFNPVDQIMVSGHLLASCLGHAGESEHERHFLIAVHYHLVKAAQKPGCQPHLKKNVELSLIMLQRHCRLHGEFGGMSACFNQTRTVLESTPPSPRIH